MKRKTVTKLSSLNSNESLRGLIVFLACVVLSGCAGIEARRRNPAETDKREASATPTEAAIRLRAGESARHASFQISLESTPCKGFKDVGVALSGWAEDEVPLKDIVELIPDPLTGDQHFLLHGRMQDLINIAGKRTSLANLDYHLNSIPGVTDGAFYMPDEDPHDHVTRLVACVAAPGLTASRLLAELRTRIDAVFLPRPLLLVASLPRNSTGKLPRDILRQFIAMHTAAAGKKATEGVPGNLAMHVESGLIEETTPPSLHPKNAIESKSTA